MSAVSSRANVARNASHCAAISSSLSLRESGTSILLAEETVGALDPYVDEAEDAAALRADLPMKRRARTVDTATWLFESAATLDGDESLLLLVWLLLLLLLLLLDMLAQCSSLKLATHCMSAALPMAAVDARSAQSFRKPPTARSRVSRSPSQSQRVGVWPALRKPLDDAAVVLALPPLRAVASSPSSCDKK